MRIPTSKHTKRRTQGRRNFRAEYQARIAKGLATGKSRSAARGHARAVDLPKPTEPINRTSPLEKALARMRRGQSQAAAARAEAVSAENLRRYRLQRTASRRMGKQWVIFDSRPQPYWVATRGKMKSVVLPHDAGSEVSAYWQAVNRFLATNNAAFLSPLEGEGVRDLNGRFHPFEVRPNVLRKLDAIGELHFIEIYADVAN